MHHKLIKKTHKNTQKKNNKHTNKQKQFNLAKMLFMTKQNKKYVYRIVLHLINTACNSHLNCMICAYKLLTELFFIKKGTITM